ncbi:CGNR zinc finger domain-containing protein [Streptomyces sp. NPDC059373]
MADLRYDTGRISLDLVATASGRPPDGPADRLTSPARLTEWLHGTGLVPPGTHLPADAAWLTGFRDLRALLHRLVDAELESRPADHADLERLNAAALAPPPAPRVTRTADGLLVRALAAEPPSESLLAAVARDAVDLLTDPNARAQLRRCEGESCSLVYLDTSRGRRRRWCSSEVCGNRERVARHRRRAVAGPGMVQA